MLCLKGCCPERGGRERESEKKRESERERYNKRILGRNINKRLLLVIFLLFSNNTKKEPFNLYKGTAFNEILNSDKYTKLH